MKGRGTFTIGLFASISGFALLLFSIFMATPAYAQSPTQDVDNGNCIKCHEDLYFLHDTGNWFCIRESPMPCVFCHGGDPTATTQEAAHYDRSAHPVVNEDISRCQECHVNQDECCECISKFDQVAGIKQVKLASPVSDSNPPDLIPGMPVVEQHKPDNWFSVLEFLPVAILAGLALTVYILQKIRHA